MLPVLIFNVVLAATVALALWKGGAPERVVAAALLAAAAATRLVQRNATGMFEAVELDILAIDLILLAVLASVAIQANRLWPIWVAGIHGLAVGAHAAKAHDPAIPAWIYGLVVGKVAYPMLALLLWGVVRHRRRLALYGCDPAWRHSPRPAEQ